MAIIDKIQLSGTVYTIGNETTTAVTSASTDNEIPTAKAVYDAIPQGGGGKAVSGGTNISITTGETADTINCTLPITTAVDNTSLNFGIGRINSEHSYSFGNNNTVGSYRYTSNYSMAVGSNNIADGGEAQFVTGYCNKLLNVNEFGSGRFNNSVSASITFGDSGNTLFSVGNGTSSSARHNAFEIRQNGDIYLTKDGQDVKLQDQLGGGGGKAVTGGTNISVTTGETADTINCTIPAFFHRNTVKGDIDIGSNNGVNSDYGILVIGRRVQSRGNPFFQYSIGIGVQPDNSNKYCQLYGQNSVGIGRGFKIGSDSLYANGINNAIAIGHNATSRNNGDITLGADTTASGDSSVAIGSGATANGSDYKMNLNNQIKVTPSNQVYISNSANTSTYCLQEKIENTEAALGGLKLVKLTQAQYDALATKDSNVLYVIVG